MKSLASLALLSIVSIGVAEVKVEQIEYHGWAGSYRISNGTVDLVVVPQIGRIMRYGFVDQVNLLWENPELAGKTGPGAAGQWANYGGDKIWPAPQKDWNWPPDPQIDGAAWTVEAIPNGVRMTSPSSTVGRVQFIREVTLHDLGTEVQFHNLLKNLGPRRSMAPWQITQVDNPYSIFLPFEPTSQSPRGWRELVGTSLNSDLHQLTTDGLKLSQGHTAYKFGAFSAKGEITASKGSIILHVQTKTYARLNYSDGGSPLQVYLSGDPLKYAELELLAPLNRMETDEVSVLDTSWRLTQG